MEEFLGQLDDELFESESRKKRGRENSFNLLHWFPGKQIAIKGRMSILENPRRSKQLADYLLSQGLYASAAHAYSRLMVAYCDNAYMARAVADSLAWCELKMGRTHSDVRIKSKTLVEESKTPEHRTSALYLLMMASLHNSPEVNAELTKCTSTTSDMEPRATLVDSDVIDRNEMELFDIYGESAPLWMTLSTMDLPADVRADARKKARELCCVLVDENRSSVCKSWAADMLETIV